MSKDLSNIPALGKDNYLEWARKISAYFRLHGLFNIIAEKERRPASDAAAQESWDEREMRAAGAIEMTLDSENATHIHGIEGKAIEMWKKLESVHNTRTPGGRFNAMDAFFSIKKEESEDLRSLIT
jgi:gag-polypeptide of LTR copia-type